MTNNYQMINIGESIFYEKINIKKLQYIVQNESKYEDIIKKEESDMRRENPNYNAFTIFEKILNNCVITPDFECTEFAYIKVTYNKGSKPNPLLDGRWYSNKSIGLAPLCCSVRHTICDGIWVDIDQVNSHPTILYQLFQKHDCKSIWLKRCITKREKFLNFISNDLNITRDNSKTKVISLINGGSDCKSETLINLKDEITPFINKIINLSEYKHILEYVTKNYKNKVEISPSKMSSNIEGKTISRILQVIENSLLECYINFFNEKGFINKINDANEVVLIFDGFQIRSDNNITDELLNECRKYAYDKTGFDIELKIKPFDNPLKLPLNYDCIFDEIPAIIKKFNNYSIEFYDKKIDKIDNIINNYTDHDIFELISLFCKDKIIYDPDSDRWFHTNVDNIWLEYKNSAILNQVIPTIIYSFFEKRNKYYVDILFKVNILKDDNDPILKVYGIKESENIIKFTIRLKLTIENSSKVMNNLKSTVIKQKIPHHKELFQKNKFKQEFLDSKSHLFAFSNKLFDFSIKGGTKINDYMRYILPTDYIQTNTGYIFPENIDEKDVDFIQKYLTDLFPDATKKQFVLDSFSTSLNGSNNEQSFNIHEGSGSNSKSTIMDVTSSCFGKYSVNISPETFTQAKKANSNSELYKLKGRRLVISNEPDDDNGNKLQTSILKTLADEGNQTIIAKELYKNPIEFKNQTSLNLCMNNKPSLSTVDGGIARRIRIITYDTKYVDNPKLSFERKLDPTIKQYMNSENIRNTFIITLFKNWISNVKDLKKIIVPKCIIDASAEYINDCNVVLKFFFETEDYKITENPKDKVKSSELFIAFKTWLKNNKSDETMSDKKFKDYLLNMTGITFKRSNGAYWCGIKEITDEELQDVVDGPV